MVYCSETQVHHIPWIDGSISGIDQHICDLWIQSIGYITVLEDNVTITVTVALGSCCVFVWILIGGCIYSMTVSFSWSVCDFLGVPLPTYTVMYPLHDQYPDVPMLQYPDIVPASNIVIVEL